MRSHPCSAIACRALVLPAQIFCERHEGMLQSDIRTILYRKFRPGLKQTAVFNLHLETAQREILDYQTSGHRTPRPAEFEW